MAYLKLMNPEQPSELAPLEPFEQEVLEHLDVLYGVAFRLTKDGSGAEDLVQDTIVKAIRAREQYRPGTNLKAWLLRILTNTFINSRRRGGLERGVLEGPDAEPLTDRWIGAETMRAMREPERQALAPLVEAEVQQALASLPDHFRMAIVLSDIEGLSYKEIAEAMDCPVGTVMSRLHRARAVLKTLLREHAAALGIAPPMSAEEEEQRLALERASGDTTTPVDLGEYRSRKRGRR